VAGKPLCTQQIVAKRGLGDRLPSSDRVASTSRQGGLLSNLARNQTSGEGLVMKFSGTGQVLV